MNEQTFLYPPAELTKQIHIDVCKLLEKQNTEFDCTEIDNYLDKWNKTALFHPIYVEIFITAMKAYYKIGYYEKIKHQIKKNIYTSQIMDRILIELNDLITEQLGDDIVMILTSQDMINFYIENRFLMCRGLAMLIGYLRNAH